MVDGMEGGNDKKEPINFTRRNLHTRTRTRTRTRTAYRSPPADEPVENAQPRQRQQKPSPVHIRLCLSRYSIS